MDFKCTQLLHFFTTENPALQGVKRSVPLATQFYGGISKDAIEESGLDEQFFAQCAGGGI
jgi:hypothetical protein